MRVSPTLFIDEDGYLWGFGNNEFGQLGQGEKVYLHDPICIDGPGVKELAAGRYHSLYTKPNENSAAGSYDLWGMGLNSFAQLGLNNALYKENHQVKQTKIWDGFFLEALN